MQPTSSTPGAPAEPAQRRAQADSEVRAGTLNIRWFPDGDAEGPGAHTTDVDSLAIHIASLDVDVLAVQELLLHERGERAMARLRERLDSITHGQWEVLLDECPRDEGRQHVGILYNATKAELLGTTQVDALSGNERGSGCDGHMRPGLAAALRFRTGVDAWFVSVHFDSGRDDRAFERRGRAFESFPALYDSLRGVYDDHDIVVLGDMNTMGSDRGVSNQDELRGVEAMLDRARYRRLWLEPGCTEISGGRASMLDHVVVSGAMSEVAPSMRARVGGPCGETRCRVEREDPWLAHISDHCPVTFAISANDDD